MHILVVDDSSPHRRLLTALFGRAGHQVHTAADGVAALEILEREPIDAVVSDVRMPRLDGIGLARVLAPHEPPIPIILMSATPLPPDCPLPALRKPFTLAELLTLMARTLPVSVAAVALVGLGAV